MSRTLLSVLSGLGGMFGWGVSDFFANMSSDEVGHLKTFFWSQLVGIVFTIFLIPFFEFDVSLSVSTVIFLAVSAVFYTAGYLLFYKAFEIGNVSVVASAMNLNVIVAMLIAVVFVGQTITAHQLFAICLILIGVTLLSINFSDFKNKEVKLSAGIKEAIWASLFFGVFWNMGEFISEKIGWLPTTLYVKIGAILSLLIFAFFSKKSLKVINKNSRIKLVIILIGILEAGAIASVNYGLEFGDLVLVSPISSALSVVTIVMAIVFLKEKITKIQSLGIITTIVGIVLTAL